MESAAENPSPPTGPVGHLPAGFIDRMYRRRREYIARRMIDLSPELRKLMPLTNNVGELRRGEELIREKFSRELAKDVTADGAAFNGRS
jgi:hypothetical protein